MSFTKAFFTTCNWFFIVFCNIFAHATFVVGGCHIVSKLSYKVVNWILVKFCAILVLVLTKPPGYITSILWHQSGLIGRVGMGRVSSINFWGGSHCYSAHLQCTVPIILTSWQCTWGWYFRGHMEIQNGSGIMTLNLPGGSTLQCGRWLWDDMPWNSPKRSPYWNSTSGFDFDHITAVDMSFCTSLRNLSKSDHPQQKKNDIMSIFKMADLSRLGF